MSQSDTASDSPALGSRDNWWGVDDDHDLSEEQPRGHDELRGVSRTRWIAGSILRQAGEATLLCPACWNELERASELSDPEDYVPRSVVEEEDGLVIELYGDHRRHRHCTNEDCGLVAWGGVLQDRPAAAFLSIVEDVLDLVDLREEEHQQILSNAQARKDRGFSDEANMERVVTEIEHPERISDGGDR